MSLNVDKNKAYTALEMARLISEHAEKWFLLEVFKQDEHGKAIELKLLEYSKDKEHLYEYLLEDENWNWDKKYIFVYSDPEKKCELL